MVGRDDERKSPPVSAQTKEMERGMLLIFACVICLALAASPSFVFVGGALESAEIYQTIVALAGGKVIDIYCPDIFLVLMHLSREILV